MSAEKEIRFRNNQVIFTESEKGTTMYYIQKGSVELYLNVGDSVVSLVTLGAGEWLGELGFFADLTRGVNARARGQTVLIQVKKTSEVQLEMKHTPDWLLHCYKSTIKQLKSMYGKFKSVGDNAIRIDYGSIRKNTLSKSQVQELLGTLILVDMALKSKNFENMGTKCIDYQDVIDLLEIFYPSFSLGQVRLKMFLQNMDVLKKPTGVSLRKDCFEIGEVYPLRAFINFLKYIRGQNQEIISLRDKEIEILEAIIMLAQVKMKHDEQKKSNRKKGELDSYNEEDLSTKPYDPIILELLEGELNLKGEEESIGDSEDEIEGKKRIIEPDNRFIDAEDGLRADRYWIKYPEEVVHQYFVKKERYSGSITHTKRLADKKLIIREIDPRSAKVYLLISLGELTDLLPFVRLIEDFVGMRAI